MKLVGRLRARRTRHREYFCECHDCGWKKVLLNSSETARRHAESLGHYVMVDRNVTLVYDGRGRATEEEEE